MPFRKKSYRQIAKDILTKICGGDVSESFSYSKGTAFYKLSNCPVKEINSVEGKIGNERIMFVSNDDYRLVEDSLEWVYGGKVPDDSSSFTVLYSFTGSSGITDVNPGSVVRTIVEAVSREIEFLYDQMEEAYFSGFLDTAKGKALDLVVSLIGIKRKPPQPSSGFVTFGRNTEPEIVEVVGEVHLYEGMNEYVLNKSLVREIVKVEGTFEGKPRIFEHDIDYGHSGNALKWLSDGLNPDGKSVFRVDYSAFREIVIPKGSRVSTLSSKPDETRLFATVEEAVIRQTSDGNWEVEVPVVCTVPGKTGNVLAGSVVVMPQPIQGVEFVINKGDIINGVEAEDDGELKERARHTLEFAGKATFSSLDTAIRSIEGVKSILIEDMPDNVPGLVKVIVDGGDMEKIAAVVDDTRAAGVKVELFRPEIVYVNISLILVLEKDTSPASITELAEQRIRSYVSSLGIGADVLYSRIIESIVTLKGVWDASDIIMTAYRADGSIVESEVENIEIMNRERAEPRTINLSFEMREKKY